MVFRERNVYTHSEITGEERNIEGALREFEVLVPGTAVLDTGVNEIFLKYGNKCFLFT